jgi:tellurite resistance protein TehA-like permease
MAYLLAGLGLLRRSRSASGFTGSSYASCCIRVSHAFHHGATADIPNGSRMGFTICPLLVAGPLAGLLISDQPPPAALRIWVGGVMFQGLGWMVATFMYAIWTLRPMGVDLPAPSMRPGAYVAVGPTGYTAQAFLTLGNRAPSIRPTDFFRITSVATGDILEIIGSIVGIFL